MVLMRVSGDSMEPEIMDNDIVLIDQGKRDVTPGRLYAIGFDEAIYLKRIDILPGKVILKDHIDHCIVDAVEEGNLQAIAELERAIDQFMK